MLTPSPIISHVDITTLDAVGKTVIDAEYPSELASPVISVPSVYLAPLLPRAPDFALKLHQLYLFAVVVSWQMNNGCPETQPVMV